MAFPFVQVNREGWQGMGQDKLWDGAKSLYEMLELEDELKPFVNDFKLNLFDYHEWKEFSRFKTANRLLFEALSCGNDRKRMKKILRENPGYKALDLESAKHLMTIRKREDVKENVRENRKWQ